MRLDEELEDQSATDARRASSRTRALTSVVVLAAAVVRVGAVVAFITAPGDEQVGPPDPSAPDTSAPVDTVILVGRVAISRTERNRRGPTGYVAPP